MRDLAFLLGFVALIPAMFCSATVGFSVVIWLTLLAPWNFLYGAANALPLSPYIIAMMCSIFLLLLPNQRNQWPMSPVSWVIALLLVQGLISTLLCPEANTDQSWAGLIVLLKISIVVVCMGSVLTNRVRIHAMAIAFTLGLGFHAVIDALKYVASGGSHVILGVLQLGDNNSYGMAMLMLAPIAGYLSSYSRILWVRLGFLGVCVSAIITATGTLSRGAFVAMGVIGILYVLRSQHRLRNLVFAVLTAALIFSIATERWTDRISTIETADQDTSFMGRVIAWKLSYVMALDNPITGLGFGAIQNFGIWKAYNPPFQQMFPDDPIEKSAHAAHSIVFQVMGDLGFPGLLIFSTMIATTFQSTRYIRKHTRSHPDMLWMHALASAFQLSLTAYVVAGLALSVAYFEPFYFLIAMIAALRRCAERHIELVQFKGSPIIEPRGGSSALPASAAP